MLLVAEFEIDHAPAGFSRRFCQALAELELADSETGVAFITAHTGTRTVRRIECCSASIAHRLRSLIAEIEPALVRGG